MTDLIKTLTETLPLGSVIVVVPPPAGKAFTSNPNGTSLPSSRDEDLARTRRDGGDEPLTLAQWGRELSGVSTRELERAHKVSVLQTQIREKGLGHGAVEATPDAILTYLELCASVQQGTVTVPEWWRRVRKGSNGRVVRG